MLKIFNTLGRELQVFTPIEDKEIKFYHCGPTVYWTQHIGNLRAMTMADLIRRSLIYMGYNVKYVRNYTDFGHLTGDNIGDADQGEDRMERAAKKEGILPQEIADKYIKEFEIDINSLNLLTPSVTARATDYIQSMIQMIQILLDKGYAYSTPSAIFFDISKFSEYTKLSGQKLDMNKKGHGHGDILDENKRNPQDFAIWFFKTGIHKNILQYWPSPFQSNEVAQGYGFPGWHIECSAMAKSNLGNTIDIHMGGVEHIPIHHTNEIAQSESANSVKYVNYWLHNEHLDVDSIKMSKSSGNVYNLVNLTAKGYSPIDLRYFFLQSHYRSKQNFTFEALDGSKKSYKRLLNYIKIWTNDVEKSRANQFQVDQILKEKFTNALQDDFNIPLALAIVWEIPKLDLPSYVKLDTLLDFDKVLGLKLEQIIADPTGGEEIPLEAKILIEERNQARFDKDWKKADEIRNKLKEEYNLNLKDKHDGISDKDN